MRCMLLGFMAMLAVVAPVRAERIPFPDSCYVAAGEKEALGVVNEAIFLLIDESVGFDANIIDRVRAVVLNWLKDGRAVEIIRFSSHIAGRYTEVMLSGRLDPEPTEDFLDGVKRSKREKFERCHRGRGVIARNTVSRAINNVLTTSNKGIPHSDILANIHESARHIKQVPAKRKIVLIVSDMLENSTITSFYSGGRVKQIGAKDELGKVEKARLFGDLDGAKVYIFGLGYFPGNQSTRNEQYLDPRRKRELVEFWSEYIARSNGKVGEIGAPLMYGGIE